MSSESYNRSKTRLKIRPRKIMSFLILKYFLCCLPLRSGALIVGIVSLACSLIMTFMCSYTLINWKEIVINIEPPKHEAIESHEQYYDIQKTYAITHLVFSNMDIVTSSLLIYGILCNRREFMIPYMVMNIIGMAYVISIYIYSFLSVGPHIITLFTLTIVRFVESIPLLIREIIVVLVTFVNFFNSSIYFISIEIYFTVVVYSFFLHMRNKTTIIRSDQAVTSV